MPCEPLVTDEGKKREKQLLQMDHTKKLFIDNILRRSCTIGDNDIYDEIVEAFMRGEQPSNTEQDKRKAVQMQMIRNQQTEVYLKQLIDSLKLEHGVI